VANANDKIAVLGAGSWGTALAVELASRYPVMLWGHTQAEVDAMRNDRENRHFLPGVAFPKHLQVTLDLSEAIDGCTEVLIVVPSHAFASVVRQLGQLKPDLDSLAWATKGFDPASNALLSDVAAQQFPESDLAVVSGPTFAREFATGMPTAITVAANTTSHARRVAKYLRSDTVRPYTSDDLAGVQVGGACKNVMAIAAGISDGLGFGANARAALITRGLHEITLLGTALGGKIETFMGLTGLGDLTLTCTDDQSRNRRMGLALAKGLTIEEAKAQIGQEVEGINTAREVRAKAQELDVEMPITEQTYQVLFGGLSPQKAVQNLLSRETRSE